MMRGVNSVAHRRIVVSQERTLPAGERSDGVTGMILMLAKIPRIQAERKRRLERFCSPFDPKKKPECTQHPGSPLLHYSTTPLLHYGEYFTEQP